LGLSSISRKDVRYSCGYKPHQEPRLGLICEIENNG
jgi:hypothetical protein